MVSIRKMDTFDLLPITRKLMEYNPIIVKIPANSAGIFNFVCNKPVTIPATDPARKASTTAITGEPPPAMNETATAAPNG